MLGGSSMMRAIASKRMPLLVYNIPLGAAIVFDAISALAAQQLTPDATKKKMFAFLFFVFHVLPQRDQEKKKTRRRPHEICAKKRKENGFYYFSLCVTKIARHENEADKFCYLFILIKEKSRTSFVDFWRERESAKEKSVSTN